jgi:hypothetical protein
MKAVYEYLLDSNSINKQTLYLPVGAEVLTVKNTEKGLLLFVLATSTELYAELHTFQICATAELIGDANIKYITTCEVSGDLRHVFEVL